MDIDHYKSCALRRHSEPTTKSNCQGHLFTKITACQFWVLSKTHTWIVHLQRPPTPFGFIRFWKFWVQLNEPKPFKWLRPTTVAHVPIFPISWGKGVVTSCLLFLDHQFTAKQTHNHIKKHVSSTTKLLAINHQEHSYVQRRSSANPQKMEKGRLKWSKQR